MNGRMIFYTLLARILGGTIFSLLRLPLPWILGPAAFIIAINAIRPGKAAWPTTFGHAGITVIAYVLGRTMTAETAGTIGKQLPWMIAAAIVWIIVCWFLGMLFSRVTKIDKATGIIGCMPGGLSQMVLVAEDTKKADPGTVALIQTARLIIVLYTIPFLAHFLTENGVTASVIAPALAEAETYEAWPVWVGYALLPLVPIVAWIARKLRIPAGEFSGPALLVGTFSVLGCPWPPVPFVLLCAAQLAIGLFIGQRVNPRILISNKILGPLALVSGVVLVAITVLVSFVVSLWTPEISIVTWFLALAPGGLGEVASTALVLGADVALVTAYQMFRLFFILLAAPPVLKRLLKDPISHKNEMTLGG